MLLNCHTFYSFCYGTYSVEELLNTVKENGYQSFVLTDINNTSACLDTIRMANEKGLKPVVGIDFRNGVQQQYVGIAINNQGFRELNEHLTYHLHHNETFQAQAPDCNNAFFVYPFKQYKGWNLRSNEFVGIAPDDLLQYPFSRYKDKPAVILHEVSFAGKRQFNAHRLLRAIDTNKILSRLSKQEQASGTEIIMPADKLLEVYKGYPRIIAQTRELINACSIDFTYGKLSNKNLKYYSGSLQSDINLLKEECRIGLKYRYSNPSDEVLNRIEKEIQVIEQLNFASYFLINWDIVKYARHKNFYYVGRGSGANSIVAYLLRITDVDPVKLDLYFERFINIYRSNAPDFDIDFSWTDRDDITRYIFNRFGQNNNTALLGAYNTFQHDAVIRELGKVFGLPPAEIDKLQHASKYPDLDDLGKQVLRYSELIKGMPSHLSIHSSGIIISEEPISTYTATNMPPKGFPTTQFSMLEAEDIGLYKFDILSQRGLGKIKDSLELIYENKGVELDIHAVDKFTEDNTVKELLREGKAIGCFYVESPAMRMLLTKLKADDYLRLVAASSIIRPGVARSGMMREYIARFRNMELRENARLKMPELYHILEETYGVMVYQEDVIKVAHLFAGLTLAEADYLRRGMSWKFKQRNEFSRVKDNFFQNCRNKNYPEQLIANIWEQIESFANFAFSKGHSASYAVESYQALYLKAHYPLEYMVATLNNGGGFYRKELYLHEARKHGATIHLPCINKSSVLCRIEGCTIYLGLSFIANLELQTIELILEEKRINGIYSSLQNFVNRLQLPVEQTSLLIRAGCFDFTGKNRKEMLWEIHAFLKRKPISNKRTELFETKMKSFKLPTLENSSLDDAFDQMELFGFTLCSPFDMLQKKAPETIEASQLKQFVHKEVEIVGQLVTYKRTYTAKGDKMFFGTFLDQQGNWIDTVHFPPSAAQYPIMGLGCYLIKGRVTEEYDFICIEAAELHHLPVIDRQF